MSQIERQASMFMKVMFAIAIVLVIVLSIFAFVQRAGIKQEQEELSPPEGK